MKLQKIGFIGTGVMGAAMAENLLKSGYELSVYNRTKEKAESLLEKGAKWIETPGKVAEWAEVVITMVSYPKDVEEIYLGEDGILEHCVSGTYVIDMTTSSPSLAQKIYQKAKEKGVKALDAPVSGGDIGAKNATLSIMVGGEEADFNEMFSIFSTMGKSVILEGDSGAGQQTKMCNQICIAGTIMGVCECLSYGKKAGLDEEKILQTLSGGGAASWQLSAYSPRIFQEDYEPGFFIKHFVKDMRIALEEAEAMELELPALKLAKSLYDKLIKEELGEKGTQALYKLYMGMV